MAVKRYYRCLDDLTGAEYYFDPKTGRTCIILIPLPIIVEEAHAGHPQ